MYSHLRILVIGLGSMGKRRIRNLQALGIDKLYGFDTRDDRIKECRMLYGITCFASIDEAFVQNKFDALIISVPPDKHHVYMNTAVEKQLPAFIEASVVDDNLLEISQNAQKGKVLLAPSCTLFFHPAIKIISSVLANAELGTLSNIVYHSGQYLPDWHTYEKVSDYYVSNKATGGAREIVPFELTWITMLLDFPRNVSGLCRKTIEIEGAELIDDTYNLILDYGSFMMSLVVDVVSRYATRRLLINGNKKQLIWDWDENKVRIFDPEKQSWDEISYATISAQIGYNKNITEQMYIDEMAAFLDAAFRGVPFPNSIEKDLRVLQLLYKAEESFFHNDIKGS